VTHFTFFFEAPAIILFSGGAINARARNIRSLLMIVRRGSVIGLVLLAPLVSACGSSATNGSFSSNSVHVDSGDSRSDIDVGSNDASSEDTAHGAGEGSDPDSSATGDTGGSLAVGTDGEGDGGGCAEAGTTPDEVVLIGDSYLDPSFSQAAVDLYADAQDAGVLPADTTYRHYYQAGASMNAGDLQFNIPYQYETQALTDLSVPMPANIQIIIMDGGGNDVLINDRTCLTSPPPGNTECVSTIQGVLARATSLFNEMEANGVQTIVYFFYPHLDPDGGGLLPSPNTANQTLDYAYPLAEQICCGTSFTSTTTNYTCSGYVGSTKCVFIDTRPAFGDNWSTLINQTDYVHPTPAGAQIIGHLIWEAMQNNCLAQ
jgi:hypothetical protein